MTTENTTTTNPDFRTGFIGIVGPTNSGKSTLLNALMGMKLSIVSSKIQTTYHAVRGIVTGDQEQLVLTDTPGYQAHKEPVARLLNRVADQNAKDCDLLAWVFDASVPDRAWGQFEKMKTHIGQLKPATQTILVLNKVDKVSKPELLPFIAKFFETGLFAEIVPISARRGTNLDKLAQVLRSRLPQGAPLYPADMSTDRPKEFLVTEYIREKIYEATMQEIPYSVWIEVEETPADERDKKVEMIRAVIHVDSDSKKGILIGKGGEMLKEIGSRARKDIEELLGHQVCLKLFVDVQTRWKENSNVVNRYLELQ